MVTIEGIQVFEDCSSSSVVFTSVDWEKELTHCMKTLVFEPFFFFFQHFNYKNVSCPEV